MERDRKLSTFVLLCMVLAFAMLLMLAGCASPGRVAIETRVVREVVPVAVSCVKPADIPAMPARVGGSLDGDAVHDVSVLASYALRLRKALDQSLALLGACTELPK